MYFKDCKRININNLFSDKYKFFAHTNENNIETEKETLKEHTDRCLYYFDMIINTKNMENVFLSIENIFFKNKITKALFREMIINTIILHDIGKINPIYQLKKMENDIFRKDILKKYLPVQTRHSILSSVIYVRYYYKEIKNLKEQLSKEERDLLRFFMLLNSYIISRHHSNLKDFYEYVQNVTHLENSEFLEINEVLCDENINLYNAGHFAIKLEAFKKVLKNTNASFNRVEKGLNIEKSVALYTYERVLFSILIACDYYATGEYRSNVKINDLGNIDDIQPIYDIYKNTDISKSIRAYQKNRGNSYKESIFEEIKDINILRNEMFLETEKNIEENIEENIFYLKAPTGAGKSNISMNLSFKLIEKNKQLRKIFYVYPFNTLIEQNIKSINNIFKDDSILSKIAVVNSITPIKQTNNDVDEISEVDYQKFLLDRQFLNYPIILTTHVSLFSSMFEYSKEASFSFFQLANSVIILDEIQCYKNSIWSEIIIFLKYFSKILNIKVIIMSATLPNLNLLLDEAKEMTNLILEPQKYFLNPIFKNRVKIEYALLDSLIDEEILYNHVKSKINLNKKIVIEFINKKSAYSFYKKLKEESKYGDLDSDLVVELMTGDDNIIERKRILNLIDSENVKKRGMILIATQVIEAGVDIDMDIGYKDISILDSEEQFMGRINRSCKRDGIVYFFNLDNLVKIYSNDYRSNKEYSLLNNDMRNILINKDYERYYIDILDKIKQRNSEFNENNIEDFFIKIVGRLNSIEIAERMKLINDNNWYTTFYLSSKICLKEGEVLDGDEIWNRYKELLKDNSLSYAKKQVELSNVRSKMNYFIYQILCDSRPCFNDQIGDIYYIEDGKSYFKDRKLDKDKFSNAGVEFF